MASSIAQIKQMVNQIGQQASNTAAQLSQLALKLQENGAQVNSAISGTAAGEDKTIVASFAQSSKAVQDAATSLLAASQAAKDWAQKA